MRCFANYDGRAKREKKTHYYFEFGSNTMVSCARAFSRWHTIWHTGWCMGHWLRVCWNGTRKCTVAGAKWCRSIVPYTENHWRYSVSPSNDFQPKWVFRSKSLHRLKFCIRNVRYFNEMIFSKGISLPVPPVIDGLESKFPSRVLKHPEMLDFARVNSRIFFTFSILYELAMANVHYV